MADKVAIVTGSNKGIGYAIVKELLKRGVGTVYLTSRDVKKGKEAVETLKKEGYNPQYFQLEVTDRNSVKAFADFIKQKHGGLDIIFNNAGLLDRDLYQTNYEDAKNIIDTNYKAILLIQEYLFPLLNTNARVINISSDNGHISNIKSPYWIARLTKSDVTVEDVNAFVDWFLECVREGKLNEDDFTEMPMIAYRVSKVALCALTRVQQKIVGKNISVNSLHPGFIKTDMTRGQGYLTIDEAGKVPADLALDIDQSVKGKYFWYDKTEKDWTNPELPLYCHFKNLEKRYKAAGVL